MKAMIFAAGLGSRIQAVSEGKPKALLPISESVLLKLVIEYLVSHQISEILINVHHKKEQILDYLSVETFPVPIHISDESDVLLETGGGLLKVKDFFSDEDFVVCNVDVLTGLDLTKMIRQHKDNQAIATLAVQKRPSSRYLLFNDNLQMVGWRNQQSKEIILHQKEAPYQDLSFSGVQIISPAFFDYLSRSKEQVFSITKSYIEASKEALIQGYEHSQDYWFDVGTPENYLKAQAFFREKY